MEWLLKSREVLPPLHLCDGAAEFGCCCCCCCRAGDDDDDWYRFQQDCQAIRMTKRCLSGSKRRRTTVDGGVDDDCWRRVVAVWRCPDYFSFVDVFVDAVAAGVVVDGTNVAEWEATVGNSMDPEVMRIQ